mgnify:CR=1 FL=1
MLAYFSRRDHLRVDAIFLRVSSLNCKKGREEKQTIFRSYSFEYSLAQGRRRESQFPLDFAGIWNCRAACSFVKEISRASSKYEISQPVCNSRTMLQLSNNTFLLKERYECFFFFSFLFIFLPEGNGRAIIIVFCDNWRILNFCSWSRRWKDSLGFENFEKTSRYSCVSIVRNK